MILIFYILVFVFFKLLKCRRVIWHPSHLCHRKSELFLRLKTVDIRHFVSPMSDVRKKRQMLQSPSASSLLIAYSECKRPCVGEVPALSDAINAVRA
jgi:hypothetical protein